MRFGGGGGTLIFAEGVETELRFGGDGGMFGLARDSVCERFAVLDSELCKDFLFAELC